MEITIFVDDSSTIHSNILMLKSPPALELKIESLFIKDFSDNSQNAKIVSTITGIA
jgi:EAL domain-containing protein (putative c-di-GMP-specific phosphodiesterase class I)